MYHAVISWDKPGNPGNETMYSVYVQRLCLALALYLKTGDRPHIPQSLR